MTLRRTERPPFSRGSQSFFFQGLLVFCSLYFPHYNWLLFYEMVGGFFFCVCMQDSAGTRGLPLSVVKKVSLPYWHSIPRCHPHCCLFGFWWALTVRVPPGSSHAHLLDYLRLSFSHMCMYISHSACNSDRSHRKAFNSPKVNICIY